jgi:acetylornithine/N-succinyldiaminopimelate aminotransferase
MSAVLPVYNRTNLTFSHGEGVYLFTPEGEKYLDFAAGIAVNSLGHSHPKLVKALTEQAKKLWHVSNLYQIQGLEPLAEKLVANSFADKVFFCNSGAEAVECGIKMIRKYHDETGNPDKYRIVCFMGAFHGRTLATISAGEPGKNTKGFEPLVDGFDHVDYGDLEAVKKAITPQTGGILIEPIQGEGGIKPAPEGFLKALRELCDKHGLLLMYDAVQCGMGRTGKLFSHEWVGVNPDIASSAKGIGGGFPMGACLATDKAAQGMKPGSHGSTYGSNPLAMAVGNAVVDELLSKGFLDNVVTQGIYLRERLKALHQRFPEVIEEIRGVGLMIGVKMRVPNLDFVNALRAEKLLTVQASDNVLRVMPPLILQKEHIDEALPKFEAACEKFA